MKQEWTHMREEWKRKEEEWKQKREERQEQIDKINYKIEKLEDIMKRKSRAKVRITINIHLEKIELYKVSTKVKMKILLIKRMPKKLLICSNEDCIEIYQKFCYAIFIFRTPLTYWQRIVSLETRINS